MPDKTPTTERIRDMYTWAYAWRSTDSVSGTDLSGLRATNQAEFDRWLEERDRKKKEETLLEAAKTVAGYRRTDRYGDDHYADAKIRELAADVAQATSVTDI